MARAPHNSALRGNEMKINGLLWLCLVVCLSTTQALDFASAETREGQNVCDLAQEYISAVGMLFVQEPTSSRRKDNIGRKIDSLYASLSTDLVRITKGNKSDQAKGLKLLKDIRRLSHEWNKKLAAGAEVVRPLEDATSAGIIARCSTSPRKIELGDGRSATMTGLLIPSTITGGSVDERINRLKPQKKK
jgi:hypothetical protein